MTDSELRILGRIEGKLDALVSTVSTNDARQETSNQDHDRRIRVLENWKYLTLGGAAVVSFIIKLL
jgi:hypothetical protein